MPRLTGLACAAALFAGGLRSAPAVLFLLVQRYFLQGVLSGVVKG